MVVPVPVPGRAGDGAGGSAGAVVVVQSVEGSGGEFLLRVGGRFAGAGYAGEARRWITLGGREKSGEGRESPPLFEGGTVTPVSRSCRWSVVSSSAGDYSADRAGVPLPRAVRRWERGGV